MSFVERIEVSHGHSEYRRHLRVYNANGGYCHLEDNEETKIGKKHAKQKPGYTVENSTESYVLTYIE